MMATDCAASKSFGFACRSSTAFASGADRTRTAERIHSGVSMAWTTSKAARSSRSRRARTTSNIPKTRPMITAAAVATLATVPRSTRGNEVAGLPLPPQPILRSAFCLLDFSVGTGLLRPGVPAARCPALEFRSVVLVGGEQRQVDRVAHRRVARVIRVQVVAAVVGGQHAGRVRGVARDRVKIDDAVEPTASADESVQRGALGLDRRV